MRKESTTMKEIACSLCGNLFPLSYAQSASRLERPHYCSNVCRDAAWGLRAKEQLAVRFWQKVDKRTRDECWPWIGRIDRRGYGRIDRNKRPQLAHRISYELSTGPIPAGVFVCHSCDNPGCCNPIHLWLGDHDDNQADKAMKGRGRTSPDRHGDNHPSSKLTAAQVRDVFLSDRPLADMALDLGVTPEALYMIKARKNWRRVTEDL